MTFHNEMNIIINTTLTQALMREIREGQDMEGRKNIVVIGTVCEARRTTKTFKGKTGENLFYFSLKETEYSKEEDKQTCIEAFAESGKKFTPSWVSEIDKGFVNTKSKFDIPVRYNGTEYNSLEVLIDDSDNDFYPMGAKVKVSLTVKNGAIYPKAVIVIENGEPLDAFADFE